MRLNYKHVCLQDASAPIGLLSVHDSLGESVRLTKVKKEASHKKINLKNLSDLDRALVESMGELRAPRQGATREGEEGTYVGDKVRSLDNKHTTRHQYASRQPIGQATEHTARTDTQQHTIIQAHITRASQSRLIV